MDGLKSQGVLIQTAHSWANAGVLLGARMHHAMILEKQTHYTIVMGDFNAKVGGQTNTSERATGCFGLGQRNERGDTLVEWATSKNVKIMNTQFQKKAGRTWTRRSPDGHTRNEIDYIMTDKPSMVTDVTVINRINIGSDHRMVLMGSITLNTRAERRKLLNKNTRKRVDTHTATHKNNLRALQFVMITSLLYTQKGEC